MSFARSLIAVSPKHSDTKTVIPSGRSSVLRRRSSAARSMPGAPGDAVGVAAVRSGADFTSFASLVSGAWASSDATKALNHSMVSVGTEPEAVKVTALSFPHHT
jgi:hypothetical protein